MEIATLDEAIEKIRKQQETLQDAMDKEKNQLQIIIDNLEDYRDKWQSVADEYEIVQKEMMAKAILGADWENQILAGRTDVLNTFKENYISIQQAIADAAWNSANEQIKAAQEAAKEAGGTPQTAPTVTTNSKPKTTVSGGGVGTGGFLNSNILKNRVFKLYGSGTDNAKKGIHLVSEHEKGDEIIIRNDQSAVVAHGEQLYPFEGGEKVLKASEAEKIIANTGNLIPLEGITFGKDENAVHFPAVELMKNMLSSMPSYSNMVQIPNFQMPKFDFVMNRSETTPVIQNINLTLPNVTNDSGYERIKKELRQMQIDAYQFAHRR